SAKHVAVALEILASDDDAGLVGLFTRGRCGIDCNNNSRQIWNCRLARCINDPVAPQRAWRVLEQFGGPAGAKFWSGNKPGALFRINSGPESLGSNATSLRFDCARDRVPPKVAAIAERSHADILSDTRLA